MARKIESAIVTGAGGFLGSHLVETLLARGVHVVGVDNFSTGDRRNFELLRSKPNARTHLRLVEADVTGPWRWLDRLPTAFRKPTHVFHFASPASPPTYQRIPTETFFANVMGLREALELAKRCGARVVFASSSEVYGDPEVHPQPEAYWGHVNSYGPRACYDEAKRAGEAMLFAYREQFGVNVGAVRIFNTYGPRMNPQDGRVVIEFLSQMLQGRPLTVFGDGSQTRSLCYVDDLVDGVLRYAQSDLQRPINLGNAREMSVREIADAVIRLGGKGGTVVTRPLPQDDPKRRRPDLVTASRELAGWAPKTALEEGLRRTSLWLEGRLAPPAVVSARRAGPRRKSKKAA